MSTQFWIVLLNVLGMMLFIAELVLLPGITVAAILSFCALVAAVALAFSSFGVAAGFMVLGIVLLQIVVLLLIFLRPKTWKRVALNSEVQGTIDSPIKELVKVGVSGVAITRLAPMGKILVDGKVFEAKTMGGYLDENSDIKVIGYDNQVVVVDKI